MSKMTNKKAEAKPTNLRRSSAITSSFKLINHGSRWKNILRTSAEDKFMQTVKLEGVYADHNRYLCIVCHHDEYCILGVDEEISATTGLHATIGLVCKIVHGMTFTFDGDGGFTYHNVNGQQYIFKPASVQALWTVIQTLHMITERLQPTTSVNENDWVKGYETRINSPQSCINEWHYMADVLVRRPPSPHRTPKTNHKNRFEASQDFEMVMKRHLREIMKAANLDTITSKKIRTQLEGALGQSLEDYKSFIDKEILVILGQMDRASQILDYLYLGSEWNASNLEELNANGITHILNVTREIDNFFPADFKYKNIRVYDEEATDLLSHFNETYKFIKEAKDSEGKVLVHCKMGISRSASCTISFIMKEYGKDLTSALIHAKEKRSIVNPNKGFIKQLEVYEGILGAFRHRQYYHNRLFRSKSESSIPIEDCSSKSPRKSPAKTIHVPIASPIRFSNELLAVPGPPVNAANRPKSWSPSEQLAQFLLNDEAPSVMKKSATTTTTDCCNCFDQLNMQISELVPADSPVNSVCNVIDPLCECNVELELSVPSEPVKVNQNDNDDQETDVIVQSLSQLPIQMRTCCSLLDDLRGTPGSASSSVSSSLATSVPTTPIFSLKRRSSVDAAFIAKAIPTPPPHPDLTSSQRAKSEVLSVKTLANMFDFKVNVTSIPFRPCSARLEDNRIFQRMAKQLDNDNETDC